MDSTVNYTTEYAFEVPEGISEREVSDAVEDYLREREGETFEVEIEGFYGRTHTVTVEVCASWEIK